MNIEWILIAEGFGSSSNGAITAIGVNQALIVTSALPITTKRAVMVHLIAENDKLSDEELDLSIKILTPSGQVLAAQTTPAKAGPRQWPDIPIAFDIFTEVPMRLTEYGNYVIDVKATLPGGSSTEKQSNFYVRKLSVTTSESPADATA